MWNGIRRITLNTVFSTCNRGFKLPLAALCKVQLFICNKYKDIPEAQGKRGYWSKMVFYLSGCVCYDSFAVRTNDKIFSVLTDMSLRLSLYITNSPAKSALHGFPSKVCILGSVIAEQKMFTNFLSSSWRNNWL